MPNILGMVKYNADGLVPAITQDIRTDEVLMMAWMNEEALKKTIETGLVHYYSRSRQKQWLKGETSGHYQKVRSISIDCDGDTLLIKADQTGAACHTGHRSCFFTRHDVAELKTGADVEESPEDGNAPDSAGTATDNAADPAGMNAAAAAVDAAAAAPTEPAATVQEAPAGPEVLGEVFNVISDRLVHPKEGSYTNYLFGKGLDKILKKIGEEACEVVVASKNGAPDEISAEIADLMYHIMVLLVERGMSLDDVYRELNHRK